MYDGYEDRRGQGAVPLGNIGASLIFDQDVVALDTLRSISGNSEYWSPRRAGHSRESGVRLPTRELTCSIFLLRHPIIFGLVYPVALASSSGLLEWDHGFRSFALS